MSASDIDANDAGGAGLEGAVGEATGGSADVENVRAVEIEREFFEEAGKFFATAADESGRLLDGEIEIAGKIFAGFIEAFGAVENAAGHDQRLGLGAGGGETTGDEEFVEALFGGGHEAVR